MGWSDALSTVTSIRRFHLAMDLPLAYGSRQSVPTMRNAVELHRCQNGLLLLVPDSAAPDLAMLVSGPNLVPLPEPDLVPVLPKASLSIRHFAPAPDLAVVTFAPDLALWAERLQHH